MTPNQNLKCTKVLKNIKIAKVTQEPNKAYLRHLLDTQIDLTTLGAGYVSEAHERFEQFQDKVMGGEIPPSDWVIDQHRDQFGGDYRLETDGPHPAPELRQQGADKS